MLVLRTRLSPFCFLCAAKKAHTACVAFCFPSGNHQKQPVTMVFYAQRKGAYCLRSLRVTIKGFAVKTKYFILYCDARFFDNTSHKKSYFCSKFLLKKKYPLCGFAHSSQSNTIKLQKVKNLKSL